MSKAENIRYGTVEFWVRGDRDTSRSEVVAEVAYTYKTIDPDTKEEFEWTMRRLIKGASACWR